MSYPSRYDDLITIKTNYELQDHMREQHIVKTTLKTMNDAFIDISHKAEIKVPVQRKWVEEHKDLFPLSTSNEGKVYTEVKLSEVREAYAVIAHRMDIEVPVKRIWIRKWASVFPMLTAKRTQELPEPAAPITGYSINNRLVTL